MQESRTLTLGELNALPRERAVSLFLELDAPLAWGGEFEGYTPGYLVADFETHATESGVLGRWLGKGFIMEPGARDHGHGYNIWGAGGREERRQRFQWERATSILDGRGCVRIRYAAFDNVYGGLDLIDEIRWYRDDIYLSTATTREPSILAPDLGGPRGRTLPTTFVLRGPVRHCAGPDDATDELLESEALAAAGPEPAMSP
jgi:hypothetical protein